MGYRYRYLYSLSPLSYHCYIRPQIYHCLSQIYVINIFSTRLPRMLEPKVLSVTEMHSALIALGKMKRQRAPDLEILLEVFRTTPDTAACPDCGLSPREISVVTDDFDDLAPRKCEHCSVIIPPERLEVFPDITTCTQCISQPNNLATEMSASDFCARCGDLMMTAQTHRGGISRYVFKCSGCGYEN